MRRSLILCLGLAAGIAPGVAAQAGGSIDLGLFGLGTGYDKSFQLQTGFGGGGRLGQ